MSQAWLQVAGLIVEYLGVLLLAWEWFTARRQDFAEREIAEQQARREEGRAMLQRVQADNPHMQRHFDMTRDVERRMAATRVEDLRRRYGGLRGWAVMAPLALVSAGFVLQLLGSWPGCCSIIGVTAV
jgi:hypothetical protein